MIILWTIIATVLSAFLYRLGGLSKEEGKKALPWVPKWMFNSKTRDIGCSLVSVLWMLLCYNAVPWWVYLIMFGLTWASLTTYWDFLFKGKDNFWMHGFMIALSMFICPIFTGLWFGLALRCGILAVAMGVWCLIFSNDWVEELGRGGFIGITLPLMRI